MEDLPLGLEMDFSSCIRLDQPRSELVSPILSVSPTTSISLVLVSLSSQDRRGEGGEGGEDCDSLEITFKHHTSRPTEDCRSIPLSGSADEVDSTMQATRSGEFEYNESLVEVIKVVGGSRNRHIRLSIHQFYKMLVSATTRHEYENEGRYVETYVVHE